MTIPILSLLIFAPLAGGLALLFVPEEKKSAIRWAALGTALAVFLLSLVLYLHFDASQSGPQFVEKTSWIGYGISYYVGVDGINLFLVLLTAFLLPVALLTSWGSVSERIKEFSILMLVLETGMIGVFLALDLFLFYVFWEAALIPMYFLIGLWGGSRRVYASLKFVLFTMAGSLLMLAGILVLHAELAKASGVFSFSVFDYYGLALPPGLQTWLFLAFTLAFAVKVPLFPLHTWLPDAHVEAPTAASVLLAAVLLKMGAYGFLRFALPVFPDAARRFLPALSALALVGIIYGGLMALVQKDMKALVAYSSVSHMGLVMLAVFSCNADGLEGGLFQMVNHGLSTGILFVCVGILYERAHTRRIADFGGVGRAMPLFNGLLLVASLSSMGLPGLNGFAGEILCFFGVFKTSRTLAVLAVSTVILSAAYLLWFIQRVMHGPLKNERAAAFPDINKREAVSLLPAIALMIGLGVFPGLVLRKMEASVVRYAQIIKEKSVARAPAEFRLKPARPAGNFIKTRTSAPEEGPKK